MNEVILIGRMTRDIEVRYTQSNVAVGQFRIAVDNGKDNQGNDRPAEFINCTIWEKQAENMQKYTGKGHLIFVKGKIKNDNYEDKQGNKIYRTYVLVSKVIFLKAPNKAPLPTEPDYLQSSAETIANSLQSPAGTTTDPYEEFGQEFVLDETELPFLEEK